MSWQVYAQNLPSIVAVLALAPRPGERVVDLCACPGGKTTHIAALMRNRGRLVACDRSPKKAQRVVEQCDAMGVDPAFLRVVAQDSRRAVLLDAARARKPAWTVETLLAEAAARAEAASAAEDAAMAAATPKKTGTSGKKPWLPAAARKKCRPRVLKLTAVVDGGGLPRHCFDRVLLDGPCSAMGLRPRLAQPLPVRVSQSTFHNI